MQTTPIEDPTEYPGLGNTQSASLIMVTLADGQISSDSDLGFFARDTRLISHYSFRIEGMRWSLATSRARGFLPFGFAAGRDALRPDPGSRIGAQHSKKIPFMRTSLFLHYTLYCASKGGVRMITRNRAIELAPLRITVNSVAPGAIKTPINRVLLDDQNKLNALLNNIPIGRMGEPENFAGALSLT
jgi:NAD(P)-dependent dehydrogenase (short-subunit alcohol dehydrogenase family)